MGHLIAMRSLSLGVSLKTIKTRFLIWDRDSRTCGPEANLFAAFSLFLLLLSEPFRVPSLSLQPFPLEKHMGSS